MKTSIFEFKRSLEKLEKEYTFFYQQYVIYVGFHIDNEKIVYDLNVEDFDKVVEMEFEDVDDLLKAKAFDQKSLNDIWNFLAE